MEKFYNTLTSASKSAALVRIAIIIVVALLLCTIIIEVCKSKIRKSGTTLKSPLDALWLIQFIPPTIRHRIDVTGRRQPNYREIIEEWLIDRKDADISIEYKESVRKWNEHYLKLLAKRNTERNRLAYEEMKAGLAHGEYPVFDFVIERKQTRYKQHNYQKSAYKVSNVEHEEKLSYNELIAIKRQLANIEYETTLKKYHQQNQRKLMTKALRERVIERDNYTCQQCGRYMPDRVGLHVDHIIPLNYGGKSVESNLQVLCDKCNLAKGNKYPM